MLIKNQKDFWAGILFICFGLGAVVVARENALGTLSRMEQKGLLTSREDPGDRRGRIVRLTEKASMASEKLAGLISAQEERIVAGLTPEQADQLQELLETVLKNVSEQPEG